MKPRQLEHRSNGSPRRAYRELAVTPDLFQRGNERSERSARELGSREIHDGPVAAASISSRRAALNATAAWASRLFATGVDIVVLPARVRSICITVLPGRGRKP